MGEARVHLRSQETPPENRRCQWGGGNDYVSCRTCGLEYDYRKQDRPPCPRALRPDPGVGQAVPSGWRDWPEDAGHENGNYQNRCIYCDCVFIGHKRRVSCRACTGVLPASPPAPAQEAESGPLFGTIADRDFWVRKCADTEAQCRQLEAENATLRAEVERVKAEQRTTIERWDRCIMERNASRAREDALAGALEPFAMCEAPFGQDWSDSDEIAGEPFNYEDGGGNGILLFTLRVGQFRKAVAALATLAATSGKGGE